MKSPAFLGVAVALLLAPACLVGADDGWVAGLEATALVGPFVPDDPYGYPAGMGAYALAHGLLPASVVAGASLDWLVFAPLDDGFGGSSMVVASVEAARAVWGHRFERGGSVVLEPFVRVGQYLRWHSLDSEAFVRSRPLVTVGTRVRLAGDRSLDFSLAVGYLALIERELRSAILLESRAGLRLGGGGP